MKKILTLISLAYSLTVFAGSLAPLNPAFLKWQRERKAATVVTNQTEQTGRQVKLATVPTVSTETMEAESQEMGLRPGPLDLSYLKNINTGILKAPTAEGFPKKYDLRSEKLLTSVKNQNPYNTCWAHAACASLESWILKSEGKICDFSERNMANLHGWDLKFNDGGFLEMAMAYLLRWSGPVDETTDPYTTPTNIPSPKLNSTRHVQSIKIVPGRTNALDNERIKRAIMDFGALWVGYGHYSDCIDESNHSYYCPVEAAGNHAVAVVGWDDAYSVSNFANLPHGIYPPGNGAWIIKNSWGSSRGENGYYYVSYFDRTFGVSELAAFSSAEPTDNYAGVYQYDDLGWVTNYGRGTTAYGANIFKATSSTPLAAVGFYATLPNTEYTIIIRTGVTAGNPASGTERLTQSGRVDDYAGYVTVPLDSAVPIAKGQSFAVIVRFKIPYWSDSARPIPVEYYAEWESEGFHYNTRTSAATSNVGESFYSEDGKNWYDLFNENLSMNVCIKAYTKGTATVTLQSLEIDGDTSLVMGSYTDYKCRAIYSDGSSREVNATWALDSGALYAQFASMTPGGRLTARTVSSPVDITIKATYAEGGVKREATMGVKILCGRPDVVTGLTASDNETGAIRLIWKAAANASTYSVYRADVDDPRKARYLGDTNGATTYADTTTIPGVTYYYFVKALNATGSSLNYSTSASGVRLLSSPNEVRATDGASYDIVTVAWNEAAGAQCYRVWRQTASGNDAPVAVSAFLDASARKFDDTTAVPDVRYTYFVTAALDATGRMESELTTSDNGYRRMRVVLSRIDVNGPSTVNPSTTVPFTANAVYSDGSVTSGVAAMWQIETTIPDVQISATGLLSVPSFSEVRPLTVRATFGGMTGEKQIVLILPAPSAATKLSASKGMSIDNVSLSWVAAANAAKHAIYRDGKRIAETTAMIYYDTTATPGTLYTYSVRGVNSTGESASAPTAEGYRKLAAPTRVTASNGVYADRIRINWSAVIGAAAYQVSRAESATGTKTVVSSWTTTTSFEDTTALEGVPYYYFVKAAATSSGDRTSDYSEAAEGLRKRVITLTDLVLNGPDTVQSGTSVRYTATASYSDGSSDVVSPSTWNVTGDARVATDGTLSSDALVGGSEKVVTLSASYTSGGVTKTAVKEVRLIPIERKVEVTQLIAAQRFPFNGLVDIDFTLANTPADLSASVTLSGRDRVTGRVLAPRTLSGERTNLKSGKHRITWNLAADYPGYHTESFTVDLTAAPMSEATPNPESSEHEAVQLWENGPYWASTNVGAEKPEDYGYYFWWGDTVGYVADTNNAALTQYSWNDVTWVSSTGERMSASPFDSSSVLTYEKTVDQLKSLGYIDERGNLTAEHDAATQHWGSGWRMPTDADNKALVDNCDWQWTTRNGVSGRIFKGRGTYAEKSIFVPSSCFGIGSQLHDLGFGYYWSSSVDPSAYTYVYARHLFFTSGFAQCRDTFRHYGCSIRPIRDSAAPGLPAISAFTAAGQEPIDGKIDFNLTIAGNDWSTSAVTLSFSAIDNVGGTNLTVRTLVYANGASSTINAAGDYQVAWNAAADLGRVSLPDVTITVTLTENGGTHRTTSRVTYASIDTRVPSPGSGEHAYVKLWANGPYWATTNIGAEKPEDYGYYFWWGDTIGYVRNASNNGWVASDGSGMMHQFSKDYAPTYNKTVDQLKSLGYVDDIGNDCGILTPECDAATQHWGSGWRIPTDAEFYALLNNCDSQWTIRNGIAGCIFTGRGAFAGNSIFLPAAGYSSGSGLKNIELYGLYRSSTQSGSIAWHLLFLSDFVGRTSYTFSNYSGFPIRPVRDTVQ